MIYGYIDEEDIDEEDIELWGCPMCRVPIMTLGVLGDLEHGRRRNCGTAVSRPWISEDLVDEEEE